MRLTNTQKCSSPAARGAFTLIELLIVLALLATLVALASGAVIRVMESQTRSNTQTALTKVQTALNSQWSRYKDQFWKEDAARLYPAQWAAVYAIAGNDPARARVIWVKLRLKQAFPISFAEALSPIVLATGVQLNPLPTYVNALGQSGITAADSGLCESGACLLLALQQSPSGGGVKLEDLGVSSSIKTFTTLNGKQVSALADGWGTPLLFCRWPTGSAVLGNNVPDPALRIDNDPVDPQGLLANANWQKTAGATQFVALCHALPSTTRRSFVLVPLVASAGPDRTPGVDAATFTPSGTGAENDNLYGRQ